MPKDALFLPGNLTGQGKAPARRLAHPFLRARGRAERRLTIAVEDLLPFPNPPRGPDAGHRAHEGHAGVGAAGMVQEADHGEDAGGQAGLPAVGDDALFGS